MAVVQLIERSFAIVVNNAGLPGLRFAHPNIELRGNEEDADVKALISAIESAAPAIWAVLEEEQVLQAAEKLQRRAVERVSKLDGKGGESCRKALAAWPDPTEVDLAEPKFIDAFGAKLLQPDSGEARVRASRVQFS